MDLFCRLAVTAASLCTALASSNVLAQDAYPVRPIRMIAPYPPGGTTDVLCRIVAQRLTDALGRQVVVENRPGAAGNIGHEIAAKAAADGYTLLLTSMGALVTNAHLYKKLPFDPVDDFTHISLVAGAGPVLVTHPALPARSVQELIALAKSRPGQLTYGSGGVGTTAHVVGAVFQSATGTDIVHVPYKGGILAITDLVGGQIAMSFSDMVPAMPQIRSGRLRALAVSTEQRSPSLPEVPTMAQAGVKEVFPGTWWAVTSPRGTPAAVVNRVNAEILQLVSRKDVKERFTELGVFAMHTTPEQMLERIKSDSPRMARFLKLAGVEPE